MMKISNIDEESALLQPSVRIEGPKSSISKVATAAIASALLLGLAYVSMHQVSSTGISNPSDLASAFGNDYNKETARNWDGSLIFLDRHNMKDCGSDPMSRFKVTDGIKFSYRCYSMIDSAVVDTYSDRTQTQANGGINFLDRHSAYCRSGYLMSQLKGSTSSDDINCRNECAERGWWGRCNREHRVCDTGFYWSFTCRKYDFESSKCHTKNTAWNELGWSNTMIFLDRHDVSCDSGSALQGFKGQSSGNDVNCRNECAERGWWGRCNREHRVCDPGFRYEYNCCSAEKKEPTSAPIARPTHAPVAEPSKKPVATPTAEPIAEPTAAPNRDAEIALEKKLLEEAKKRADDAAAAIKKLEDEQRELQRIEDEKAAAVAALEAAAEAAEKKRIEDAQAEKEAEEQKAAAAKKIAEDAVKQANKIAADLLAEQEKLAKANEVIADIKELKDERSSTIACPFSFKQGVSKVVVPAGCVFFGTNDVTFSNQKKEDTPAVYFCTKEQNFVLEKADLTKYGLDSSISFIQPGKEMSVEFFSGEKLKGQSSIFYSTNHKPLNSFLYKDGSSANDRVESASIKSTFSGDLPKSCNELNFSEKMELNAERMMKDGKF